MIAISVFGLDQFVVGKYSSEHTQNLAQAYECDEDEINFCAPESMIFHKGVEQTSWNSLIVISAEEKYRPFEEKVANYILSTLKDFCIHIEIRFEYYRDNSAYKLINDDYPLYLTEKNIVSVDDEYNDEDVEEIGEEEVYTGNVFEGMDEKLEKAFNPENYKDKK